MAKHDSEAVSRSRRLFWFLMIWIASVCALGVVAWILRWLIRA